MVRRSKPGQKTIINKPMIKPKEEVLQEKQFNLPVDETFPLANDPIFNSMSNGKKLFVYYSYLKPITGWTNTKIYLTIRPAVTPESANVLATKFTADKNVQYCLNKLKELYNKRLGYTPDRIMQELGALSFSDISEFCDDEGNLITNPRNLPPHARAAIASTESIVNNDGDTVWKIKLWNKNDAIKQLVSLAGYTPAKKIELTGKNGEPIQHNHTHNHKMDLSNLTDTELKLLDKIVNINSKLIAQPDEDNE